MSVFADLDWDSVPDDPFGIPDNTYIAFVTDVKVGPTKAGDKTGMTLTYTIDGGGYGGRTITEWKEVPQPADPRNLKDWEERAFSFLKARFRDLGIPNSRMSGVTPDDLVGTRVVVTTRQKGQYVNVVRVQRVSEEFTIDSLD